MNKKTSARMRRAAGVFQRLQTGAEREIRRLETIKHLKGEDFAAAVALREVADLCKRHAAAVARPLQFNLKALLP